MKQNKMTALAVNILGFNFDVLKHLCYMYVYTCIEVYILVQAYYLYLFYMLVKSNIKYN